MEAFERSDYPEDAIFFFDFDGVLADQVEEKVFRLPASFGEREDLEIRADLMGIDHRLYASTGYLRHLVIQGLMLGAPIALHEEAIKFALHRQAAEEPFFIVTARSGLYAIQRMLASLETNYLYPQEVFCLGRSSKAELLSKLRKDWPDRPFVYFEDSMHHIEAVKELADPNITIVEVQWPGCTKEAEALRLAHLGY